MNGKALRDSLSAIVILSSVSEMGSNKSRKYHYFTELVSRGNERVRPFACRPVRTGSLGQVDNRGAEEAQRDVGSRARQDGRARRHTRGGARDHHLHVLELIPRGGERRLRRWERRRCVAWPHLVGGSLDPHSGTLLHDGQWHFALVSLEWQVLAVVGECLRVAGYKRSERQRVDVAVAFPTSAGIPYVESRAAILAVNACLRARIDRHRALHANEVLMAILCVPPACRVELEAGWRCGGLAARLRRRQRNLEVMAHEADAAVALRVERLEQDHLRHDAIGTKTQPGEKNRLQAVVLTSFTPSARKPAGQ